MIDTNYHYAVYSWQHLDIDGEQISNHFIVLKDSLGIIVRFTGLELFAYPYTGQWRMIRQQPREPLVQICTALNSILSKHPNIPISAITAQMVFDELNRYRERTKPQNKESYTSQQSLSKHAAAVCSFFSNAALSANTALKPEDLMHTVYIKKTRQSAKVKQQYVPRYSMKAIHSAPHDIFRDFHTEAAHMLIEEAEKHDRMLVFPIVAQLTAGLRPSEAMNVRDYSSPLSKVPGIKMHQSSCGITGIEIDLTREFPLRSDGVSVGKIKKERTALVYPPYIPLFIYAYRQQQTLLLHSTTEKQYRPLTVARNGKAMTVDAYRIRFQALVHNHLRPRLKASDKSQLQALGAMLDDYKLSPHALRHAFTVGLVLEGLNVAELMTYRGDTSPESALAYLQAKGELVQRAAVAHEVVVNTLRSLPQQELTQIQ